MSHYLFLHSAVMDGPSLLKALMDAAGDNAYAVATSLRKPALQSYIWKFLNGKAKEPRRASLQPLADRYRVPVDAFYDPKLADRVAADRGLLLGRSSATVEAPTLSPRMAGQALQEPDEIARALGVLAKVVTGVDKATQAALLPLFAMLVSEPDQYVNIAHAVCKLIPTTPMARRLHDDEGEGGLILDLPGGGMIQSERVSDQKREKGGR